ncbi:MAG: metallophosphoesterase [Melioribacter sp.]|uniref:metallophosphoesterase family protein n=1 Tax=Rosettibacter primus TaxID=3111523 RepID=UPI00247C1EC7|nr:metallophosphoesterase [Melioribacter sp.]
MKKIKLAHISDLHLCKNYKKQNIRRLQHLIKLAVEENIDHLIITGDISDNSNENDYIILRKILETNKLFNFDKTSLVIGNHDIFGGIQSINDISNFPLKCLQTNYEEKILSFKNYFKELFENTITVSKNIYPYAKIIGNIVLIGLNSIDKYSKVKNPFASNGKISKQQKKELKKLFDLPSIKSKLKIIMIHHHFYKNNVEAKSSFNALWNKIESYTMKLRGKKKLIKLFKKNNVKLVLHGHSHELKEYSRKGIKFINAGGSIESDERSEPGLFIIEIDNENIKINLKIINADNNSHQKEKIYNKEIFATVTS